MHVAGEDKAPTRQHLSKAAQEALLPPTAAKEAIDQVLALVTPTVLLALVED